VCVNPDALYRPFPGFKRWANPAISISTWDAYLARLKNVSASAPGQVETGLRRSLVAAALNSGAIEGLHGAGRGLTETVMDHALEWQPHVRDAEGSLAEAFVEAGLEAFQMALDVATGQEQKLTQAWIRQVHAVACAPQTHFDVVVRVGTDMRNERRPLAHGAYKVAPNHVTVGDRTHAYCPVDQVAAEMERLVDELHSDAFVAAHPILQTSFAHHAFASIHPFQDGNGRVARVFASVFLLRAASIPLLVYADQQVGYFDALAAADNDQLDPFVRFIEDRALDLLALAADLLAATDESGASPKLVLPGKGLDVAYVNAAERLADVVCRALESASGQLQLPSAVTLFANRRTVGLGSCDVVGRRTVNAMAPVVTLQAPEYATYSRREITVYATDDARERFAFSVDAEKGAVAEFRFSDVSPEVTESTRIRIEAFAKRIMGEMVADLQSQLNQR
jgi:Fic family protein